MVLSVLLKVSEMGFVGFPLRDMLDINCWLSLIPPPSLDEHGFREQGSEPTAGVTALDIISSHMSLNLDCHNCTSPSLFEFSELLTSEASQEDMTETVNKVLHSLSSNLGGAFLQDQINRILVEAPRHCGHSEAFDPEATPTTYEVFDAGNREASPTYIPMLIAVFLPFVISGIVAFFVRRIVFRRQKQWLAVLPSEQIFLIQQKQEKRDQEEAGIDSDPLLGFAQGTCQGIFSNENGY